MAIRHRQDERAGADVSPGGAGAALAEGRARAEACALVEDAHAGFAGVRPLVPEIAAARELIDDLR